MLRQLSGRNVYEAALLRMEFIFREFPDAPVGVSTSGGKDSTVVFEMANIVRQRLGIKKIPVMWLDQECEFDATVRYVEYQMNQDWVDPVWLQIPFRLSNSTSHLEDFLHVWDADNPGDMDNGGSWMREKHPLAIHDNILGADRFATVLNAANRHYFHHGATMTGVRTEESPNRRKAMTSRPPGYKWVTWATTLPSRTWDGTQDCTRFAPIYDWTWRDVWKTIHDQEWRYNTHYDDLWRHGVPQRKMRVSNFHHETAVWSLFNLQEIEPDTYAKATRRLHGIHTYGHLTAKTFKQRTLPWMFASWHEYRDYLIEKLCPADKAAKFHARFASTFRAYPLFALDHAEHLYQEQALAVIENDWEFVRYPITLNDIIPRDLKIGPEHERLKAEAAALHQQQKASA